MADEIDLSARSTDARTVAAVRRYMNCSQATATLSTGLTSSVHIPVCAIPATTTGTPAAWLEILLPSFGRSCPIAQSMNFTGCDGCRYCRSCIGFHIRLCNLRIIPPRNFAVTITKDVRDQSDGIHVMNSGHGRSDGQYLNPPIKELETIIFETDACRCELNAELPEMNSALSVAAPCIQSLDEAQKVSGPDVTGLYVFTGHRWVLREEWVLICDCW